ncbi:hypothetical protein [Actinacidiphila oryziradicis]|uniref:Uncharacterized protein n=1 Tax=Actinacidiphila oryziradicis TaxID=2571141 RepID=A0A4U0S6N0_9ACTN|nr:hypothetical protein [Actinacidiphila oryziradicis]TJZ96064.1 hypothetical protein FCI23_51490 [Actinacidiphila oryziradicis]
MRAAAGTVTLAAIWSPPDHPFTRIGTVAAVVVAIGCLVVLSGVLTTVTILRSAKPPRRKGLRPALTVGGVIAAAGAVIAALGAWLYR